MTNLIIWPLVSFTLGLFHYIRVAFFFISSWVSGLKGLGYEARTGSDKLGLVFLWAALKGQTLRTESFVFRI